MCSLSRRRLLAAVLVSVLLAAGCGDESTTQTSGDLSPPATVTNLRAILITDSMITLAWSVPGDDGSEGQAAAYDLRYATTPADTAIWWDSLCTPVDECPSPGTAGTTQSFQIQGLAPETDYYFALRTADEVPNWSDLSNIVEQATAGPIDRVAPDPVTDLTVTAVSDTSASLAWTASGDDGAAGTAARYDLRYATAPIDEDSWDAAQRASGEPTPQAAGSAESFEVVGLTGNTTYWFALKCGDETPNYSALSNVVSGTPDANGPATLAIEVVAITATTVTLRWTAPGDDGDVGTAAEYDLRYAETDITSETWADATPVADVPEPAPAGSEETVVVTGLESETLYYFAARARDEIPNWSDLSASVTAITPGPGGGQTLTVRADGSGDYPTIQAAIAAAVWGDVIELADGTYTGEGNRDLDYLGKAITVRSQSGDAEACIIDCEASSSDRHRGFYFHSGENAGAVLEDLTITGGHVKLPDGRGGGIFCHGVCSPRFERVVLLENRAEVAGGGMSCQEGASPTLIDCVFQGNGPDGNGGRGGGFESTGDGSPTLEGCEFFQNTAQVGGGASIWSNRSRVRYCLFYSNSGSFGGGMLVSGSLTEIDHCTFAENYAEEGGAICVWSGAPVISHCTLVRNAAGRYGGGVRATQSTPTIESTLIAYSWEKGAIVSDQEIPPLSCCNLYGNGDGDWVGVIADQLGTNGNISLDPELCSFSGTEFYLRPESPCAAENNPECGQIGAYPVGCDRR